MSQTAIKVENVGKLYRLGTIGTGTISHDLNRWYARMRGKEDPFAKIGEANDRTAKGSSDYVWALKDVSFEVRQGEVLGIIGRNGAGKSTLLKILSKVTTPSSGQIKIKGRIASLLEVGTGFHPELTGRENIFLNGAILGMTKGEIRKKFDAIVDFAGVERYIDTPVKRYSSGMYVRLAFAVAAFLEPEILIVDEVLAVGDAEFQEKCLGRMQDVSRNDGRTVLFVSHNMAAVKQLCNKGILMNRGQVECSGAVDVVLEEYIRKGNVDLKVYSAADDPAKPIQILTAAIVNEAGEPATEFAHMEPIHVTFTIKHQSAEKDVRYNIALRDVLERVIMIESLYAKPNSGYQSFTVALPSELLTPTKFKVGLTIDIPSVRLIEVLPEYFSFQINAHGSAIGSRGDTDFGFLVPKFKWKEHNGAS